MGTSGVNFLSHWSGANTVASISVQSGQGRLGGSSLRFSKLVYADKSLDQQQTWGVACAFRLAGLPTSAQAQLIQLIDNATIQIDVRVNTDGTISVTRNGTVLGTTTSSWINPNTYTHLEFKGKIDPSVGTYEVKVNGVSRLSGTGANTRATANSYATTIRMGLVSNSDLNGGVHVVDYDDIIVWDTQANDAAGNPDISNFIGDCRLSWLLPTGAGATTAFTPDSGSNYARVNEATPDITSYVESSTIGHTDTYAMGDLSAAASSVKSVAVVQYARKTDAGSRQMAAVLRSGGTDYAHATGVDLNDSYLYSFRNWGTNPNTVTTWTVSDVNALEVGQKVTS